MDRLGKALGLYAAGWDKVAHARLDQDAAVLADDVECVDRGGDEGASGGEG